MNHTLSGLASPHQQQNYNNQRFQQLEYEIKQLQEKLNHFLPNFKEYQLYGPCYICNNKWTATSRVQLSCECNNSREVCPNCCTYNLCDYCKYVPDILKCNLKDKETNSNDHKELKIQYYCVNHQKRECFCCGGTKQFNTSNSYC